MQCTACLLFREEAVEAAYFLTNDEETILLCTYHTRMAEGIFMEAPRERIRAVLTGIPERA